MSEVFAFLSFVIAFGFEARDFRLEGAGRLVGLTFSFDVDLDVFAFLPVMGVVV